TVALAAGGCAAAVFVITTATMAISPTRVPDGLARMFLFYCFERSTAVGIPAIIVATLLAAPTLPIRPSVVGALYGFGSGLFADAGWRLFCNVSEPAHVLLAHGGAILALTIVGAAAGRG